VNLQTPLQSYRMNLATMSQSLLSMRSSSLTCIHLATGSYSAVHTSQRALNYCERSTDQAINRARIQDYHCRPCRKREQNVRNAHQSVHLEVPASLFLLLDKPSSVIFSIKLSARNHLSRPASPRIFRLDIRNFCLNTTQRSSSAASPVPGLG
jgi:hypothetical protein